MRQRSGGYVQNFKSICKKIKKSILWVIFWGTMGSGGLDCGQYQILTDPRNSLKNPNMNFGNDRSHRLGGVWWQTDRRQTDDRQTTGRPKTDDRQTEILNPSVPYDTFACFAGLTKICIPKPAKLWPEQIGSCVRSFKSIYAKLKMVDLRMHSCAPYSWDPSHDL